MWSSAEEAYFAVGASRYIPSDRWMSSFIAHDDNFGSDFCIPRLYVAPEKVSYVATLHLPDFRSNGMVIEAIGSIYLQSVLPCLTDTSDIEWLVRTIECVKSQDHVLRALALSRDEYVQHLLTLKGWGNEHEADVVADVLTESLPQHLWVIEISLPDLFAANKRKVGEIVLDAEINPSSQLDFTSFLLARLPGKYIFFDRRHTGKTEFLQVPSGLTTHTPLCPHPGQPRSSACIRCR